MPAGIRRLRFADGSIRLGPKFFKWGDPYTRALSFEVERVNVAVIGGLTDTPLNRDECLWLEAAFIEEGLRGAMDRVIKGSDGKPLRDASGRAVFRRVMLPMPNWPHKKG